jgi:hypothetical protein
MNEKIFESKITQAWLFPGLSAILICAMYGSAGAAKEPTSSNKTLEFAPIIRDFRRPPPGKEITPEQQRKLREEAKKHPQTIGPQGADATYVNGVSKAGVVLTLEDFRRYVKKIGRDKFVEAMPVFRKYLDQSPPTTWTAGDLRFKNGKARSLLIVEQDDWKKMCRLSGLNFHIGGKSDALSR